MSRVPSGSEPPDSPRPFQDDTVAVPRASIDWHRSLPWWRLLSQSLSISWRASHLFVAAAALGLTVLGWWLASLIFGTAASIRLPAWSEPTLSRIEPEFHWFSPLFGWFNELAKPLSLRQAAYAMFGLLWTIGIWSFFGGLLARRSLMELGNRTSVGWGPSCRLVYRRWPSMVWATTMPLLAVFGLSFVPLGLGLVARTGSLGSTVALVLMLASILFVIAIGWCIVVSLFGFPLSICAVVGEKKADAFDGLSRSAAYVFQRPMTVFFILISTSILAYLGIYVLDFVLTAGQTVVWKAFEIGSGRTVGDISQQAGGGPSLLFASRSLIALLQAGFVFSFFWSASAAAYLTLRYEIDHTDFDDLDLQEIGEPVPMPKVKESQCGVAEVVPTENE